MNDSFARLIEERKARDLADAERFAALDDDLCQLCHAYGEDKRGLFVACFYEIREVVPEAIYLGEVKDEHYRDRGYYLRICKACRGSFLGHLKAWRDERLARRSLAKDHDGREEETDPERNIPVRINGAVVMLTRAEWDARASEASS